MKALQRVVLNPLLFILLAFGTVSGTAVNAAEQLGEDDVVLRGDARCTRCHDENELVPVFAISKTKHGTFADARTPTCTSCHGESDNHINKKKGQKKRGLPDVRFGRRSTTPLEERTAICLDCHQSGAQIHWATSIHAAREVACTSCHQIHTGHDKVRDRHAQSEVCFNCHKDKRAQISRPSRHPILEGKMACSDCHNPHGSVGPAMMARDTVNDTCFTCHMEKRGPFVFNHQPVSEDCGNCHNPHGTINAAMLKMRSPFLCQQCHEPTDHQGTVGALNTGSGFPNPAATIARGCLNCHTNIHGTNNPINANSARSLRR